MARAAMPPLAGSCVRSAAKLNKCSGGPSTTSRLWRHRGRGKMPEPREIRFRLVNGQVHGLWFDAFERLYRELGIAEVRRASQVEWNDETAKWEVYLAD